MANPNAKRLGAYLRARRGCLHPHSFGLPVSGRRTPGLRREEVAHRANISPTWYTWLEQGRGGSPSADVLNRLANGLAMDEAEREHLFILALGRPPEIRHRGDGHVTPCLQRVLDAMPTSAAIINNATWDVVAWNRAAALLLTDYGRLNPRERNILRLLFLDERMRSSQAEWESTARFFVGAFRAEAARAGVEINLLVDELCAASPAFATMWNGHEVRFHGEGIKRLLHSELGPVELEYSCFAVDGRPELGMLVYNPIDTQVTDRIRHLLEADLHRHQRSLDHALNHVTAPEPNGAASSMLRACAHSTIPPELTRSASSAGSRRR